MANRAAGKGYENEDNYDNIRFKFIGIENIHVMRNSLQKLLEGRYSPRKWPVFISLVCFWAEPFAEYVNPTSTSACGLGCCDGSREVISIFLCCIEVAESINVVKMLSC